MPSIRTVPIFIAHLITRLVKSAWNGRPFYGLPLNFALNFSPVFLWLAIFKNAGLIPTESRPKIHVRLAYDWDLSFFAWSGLPFWLLFSALFTAVWYGVLVRNFSNKFNLGSSPLFASLKDLENQFECDNLDSEAQSSADDDSEDSLFVSSSEDELTRTPLHHQIIPINVAKITRSHAIHITPILMASIWPILNIVSYFATPATAHKDITAWFFYVLGHITFPILTAVWLYVFHPQGAPKAFSIALGTQNVAGVCTHLLFPNAPPWFIHMYGPDADADYSMPGYAAGLTRVDVALGTHMHSNGFHKSPIVFGAFPSIHSAMAFQVCLFIWYFAHSTVLRVCGILFVAIQWWATIYLDHHFRIDLVAGAAYASLAFAAVYPLIRRKEREFMNARLQGDFSKGSTMGMRVFKGFKRAEKFFDPYR